MIVQSFAPIDPENGDRYLVSPITGELLVIPERDWGTPDAERALASSGISSSAGECHIVEPDEWPTVSTRAQTGEREPGLRRRLSFTVVAGATRVLALSSVAKLIARLPRAHRPMATVDALARLRGSARQHPRRCLVTSFQQAIFLVRHGVPCAVTVGVWIPTNDMHAWTTVPEPDGAELLVSEPLDKVGLYQPALRFTFC